METKDHFLLAIQLNKTIELGQVKRLAFLFGNLMPDINPCSYLSLSEQNKFKGHNYSFRKQFFEGFFRREVCDSVRWWYRTGNLVHYLADAFTRPHNGEFPYTFIEHVKYEHHLHEIFRKQAANYIQKTKEPFERNADIYSWIEKMHLDYLKTSADIQDDCLYILNVTNTIYEKLKEWLYLSQKDRRYNHNPNMTFNADMYRIH